MKAKIILVVIVTFVVVSIRAIYIFHNASWQENNSLPKVSKNYVNASVSPTTSVSLLMTPSLTPQVTHSGTNTCNSLLVLVDKTYGLSSNYTPPDLVYLSNYDIPVVSNLLQGRYIEVHDLVNMINASKSAGLSIIVVSPYRSFAAQAALHAGYVAQNGPVDADTYSAQAGHSQHQLGTAIDFSSPSINDQLEQTFEQTPEGSWLSANAYKYGFYIAYPDGQTTSTGYEYEPWHFRYIGIANALSLKNSGLNMEQYLLKYGVLPNC